MKILSLFVALLLGGISTADSHQVYSQTTAVPVSSTTATSLFAGDGTGTTNIDASWLVKNHDIRVHVRGSYSTILVPGSCTITIKLGTTTILTGSLSSLLGSITSQNFDADFDFGTRTFGTSGTIIAEGNLSMTGVTSNLVRVDMPATVTTLDTTQSYALTITATFGTTGNTMTVNTLAVYTD